MDRVTGKLVIQLDQICQLTTAKVMTDEITEMLTRYEPAIRDGELPPPSMLALLLNTQRLLEGIRLELTDVTRESSALLRKLEAYLDRP